MKIKLKIIYRSRKSIVYLCVKNQINCIVLYLFKNVIKLLIYLSKVYIIDICLIINTIRIVIKHRVLIYDILI